MRHAHWLGFLIFPAAAAALLAGPEMVGRAEGCSGSGPDDSPGWQLSHWPDDLAAPTDAVVVFTGTLQALSDADGLAAFHIEVTDAANVAVSGTKTLETLAHESMPGARWVAVIWKPDAPLAPASTYTVSWSVDPSAVALSRGSISGQGTLQTNGASGSVPGPTGSAEFARYRKLVGDVVSCQNHGLCHPEITWWFGTTEAELPALDVSITHTSHPASAYQLTRIEPVVGKGTLYAEPAVTLRKGSYDGSQPQEVLFSDDLPEYCVRLVTRDLRNDAITISPEICASASSVGASGWTLADRLANCAAPPNDSLKDEWCAVHPTEDLCQPTGAGGSGATGAGGSGATGAGGSGATGANGSADDGDSGCSIGVSRHRSPVAALALALLVLGGRVFSSRRRSASRSGSASPGSPNR